MRYMSVNGVIQEGQALTINGVQYPGDWPKYLIPGLEPITETESGAASNQVATSTIENCTVVWTLRDMTEEELAVIKASKWEDIKIERDRRIADGGYKVGEKWFHSEANSRTQQLGLVLLGNNIPQGLQWKTMDGSFIAMTPTLAQQILGAAAASDFSIFVVGETHKAAVYASSDPASYDITTSWPEIYS